MLLYGLISPLTSELALLIGSGGPTVIRVGICWEQWLATIPWTGGERVCIKSVFVIYIGIFKIVGVLLIMDSFFFNTWTGVTDNNKNYDRMDKYWNEAILHDSELCIAHIVWSTFAVPKLLTSSIFCCYDWQI